MTGGLNADELEGLVTIIDAILLNQYGQENRTMNLSNCADSSTNTKKIWSPETNLTPYFENPLILAR